MVVFMMTVWMMWMVMMPMVLMMTVVVMAMVMYVSMSMVVPVMVSMVWMVVMSMVMIKWLRHRRHLNRHRLLLRINNRYLLLLVYCWECHFVFFFVGSAGVYEFK